MCSDALVKRYGVTLGRRAVAMSGLFLAAVCLYIGAQAENPYTAVVMLSLGDGFLYFGAAGVGTVIDIAGAHSGTVYGVTVTATQIGGAIAPTFTPMHCGPLWLGSGTPVCCSPGGLFFVRVVVY